MISLPCGFGISKRLLKSPVFELLCTEFRFVPLVTLWVTSKARKYVLFRSAILRVTVYGLEYRVDTYQGPNLGVFY